MTVRNPLMKIKQLFDKPRVKVELRCACGPFIPGAYTPDRPQSRYGCDPCGVELRLSTFRGEVNW